MSDQKCKERIKRQVQSLAGLMFTNGYELDELKLRNKYERWEYVAIENLPSRLSHYPPDTLQAIDETLTRLISALQQEAQQ